MWRSLLPGLSATKRCCRQYLLHAFKQQNADFETRHVSHALRSNSFCSDPCRRSRRAYATSVEFLILRRKNTEWYCTVCEGFPGTIPSFFPTVGVTLENLNKAHNHSPLHIVPSKVTQLRPEPLWKRDRRKWSWIEPLPLKKWRKHNQ